MEADLGRRGRRHGALRLSVAESRTPPRRHAAATRGAGSAAGRPAQPLGELRRPGRRPRAASRRHLPGGRDGDEGAPGGDADGRVLRDLEKAIDGAWRAQQAEIERVQAEFHAADETTARSERESLEARLSDARARLEPMDVEIRHVDTELAELRRQ